MPRQFLGLVLLLSGCATTIKIPDDFRYQEIQTSGFKADGWQKFYQHIRYED